MTVPGLIAILHPGDRPFFSTVGADDGVRQDRVETRGGTPPSGPRRPGPPHAPDSFSILPLAPSRERSSGGNLPFGGPPPEGPDGRETADIGRGRASGLSKSVQLRFEKLVRSGSFCPRVRT